MAITGALRCAAATAGRPPLQDLEHGIAVRSADREVTSVPPAGADFVALRPV